MKDLAIILQKVVIKPYYRQNAGFFLVLFIFAFGLQSPPSLLLSPVFLTDVISEPVFITAVLLLFFLYYLKCFNFINKTLNAPENSFLQITALLPFKLLLYNLIRVHALLFFPALAYTLLMTVYAFLQKHFLTGISIILYNMVLLFCSAIYFYRKLSGPLTANVKATFFPRITFIPVLNTVYLWYWRYLVAQEKVLFFLTKVFSGSILLVFLNMYPYPNYDLRPTQIGFWTAVVSHVMLIQRVQLFQEKDLAFLRNLPYSHLRRFWHQALFYGLCLIPELVLIVWHLPFSTTILFIGQLFALGISFMLLMHALLYLQNQSLRKYVWQVFFIFMAFLLFFLTSPPLYLLTVVISATAYVIFSGKYYAYEPEKTETAA